MARKRRTAQEIEKDYRRVYAYFQEHEKEITSLEEIVNVFGLTEPQVKKSLEGHPIVRKKVLNQIEKNRVAIEKNTELSTEANTEQCAELKENSEPSAESNPETITEQSTKPKSIRTLLNAQIKDGALKILHFKIFKQNKLIGKIRVMSDGKAYDSGEYTLKIGDDVYIATDRGEFDFLIHFRIINLDAKDNCEFVMARNIYKTYNIYNPHVLPEEYRIFMENYFTELRKW